MTNKIRVMHVGPDPRTQGGMASVIAELLSLNSEHFTSTSTTSWRPKDDHSSLFLAVSAAATLWRTRATYDVLHAHVSERGSYLREGAMAAMARILGKPSVITLHGADSYGETRVWRAIGRAMIRRATVVIALGPGMAATLEASTGVAPYIIPNPVNVPSPADLDHNFLATRVVFAGEVGSRKGFDLLEAAWPLVQGKIAGAELRICGPVARGFQPPAVDGAHYLGILDRDNTIREIASASVVCLPSRKEVLPMTILEALANGLRVVCSDAGESALFAAAPGSKVLPNPVSAQVLADALVESLAVPPSKAERESANAWAGKKVSHGAIEVQLRDAYSHATRLEEGASARG